MLFRSPMTAFEKKYIGRKLDISEVIGRELTLEEIQQGYVYPNAAEVRAAEEAFADLDEENKERDRKSVV